MMPVEAVVRLGVPMTRSHTRLFCRLDGLTYQQREQERAQTLNNLGLLETDLVPLFDEATQTAAQYLETPICILSLMVGDEVWFKSAVGLSQLGLMNRLAAFRKILREDSFSAFVVDSGQNLIIEDATKDELFAAHPLVQNYGIRAYLGTPLMSAANQCIGALEVMDLMPRLFTLKDAQFLDLTARWCIREYEQNYLYKNQLTFINSKPSVPEVDSEVFDLEQNLLTATTAVKTKLLKQLSEKLLTPLTSVVGMASVLKQEMYGPLTRKQREYIDIIHNSGQNMISLAEEIINLGFIEEHISNSQLTSVDIELLCQQVINSVHPIAQKQKIQMRLLPVNLPNRSYLLNKEKVRQTLYYLLISLAQSTEAVGELCIQIENNGDNIEMAIWLTNSWFGANSPVISFESKSLTNFLIHAGLNVSSKFNNHQIYPKDLSLKAQILKLLSAQLGTDSKQNNHKKMATGAPNSSETVDNYYCSLLELLFSCYLAENLGGNLALKLTSSGYRYILKLPKTQSANNI